ncbi:hypothetical protein HN960_02620 [Candidatus Peregrinibacteria bacterium]|jgi:hypothetical protein|nr:hypothetical protein [Candidatus Peregrinibacteria bacterium]
MNRFLRLCVTVVGIVLLGQSIIWSKDGFGLDFEIGNDSVVFVGFLLAIVASLLQFILSTDFIDLNPTLVFLGVLAYFYSIYTNAVGIGSLQAEGASPFMKWALAFLIDMSPELMISWGLGESRSGDLFTTIGKSFADYAFSDKPPENKKKLHNKRYNTNKPSHKFTREKARENELRYRQTIGRRG